MRGVWLIILLGLSLLFALDAAFVSWWYALEDRPARLDVPTADGWTVVAWHRPAVQRRYALPVVLCHGLANNHAIMEFRGQQNLAKFLSGVGFDCYSVDLRGAGGSRAPDDGPNDANFDDHVKLDLPALVDAVCKHAGSQQVVWVGHSLGGLVALAAASSTLKDRIAALVTIGSPVFFRLPRRVPFFIRIGYWISVWGQFDTTLLRLIAPFAGRGPAPRLVDITANLRNMDPLTQRFLVANVFAPMWSGVLRQLEDWLVNDAFRSVDRSLDYREGIPAFTAPTLVLGGTVDLLAPPDCTRQYFELLRAPVRELQIFGKTYGHSAEYGHGDLMVGMQSHVEVYPVIHRFLEAHVPGNS
jgi:pimeloyl-ACP methyl ester carboxylesterase